MKSAAGSRLLWELPGVVAVSPKARACRIATGIAAAAVLSGCYTVSPVGDVHALSAGHSVVLHLNDTGRASVGEMIGPEVRAVEGSVVRAGSEELTLGVRAITYINGSRNLWNGEQITLRRQHLGSVSRQQLSRSRSAILAAAGATALAVLVSRSGLVGSGNALPRDPPDNEKPDN